MTDLINSRLFVRVERSLRKRLNMDVTPHLHRFASHARNEDEFMTSAARLLLNANERQQWLASWTNRRHVDGGDTSPAELEPVPPVAAAPDMHTQRTFPITPGQRERLRQALLNELGPIADVLLDSESMRVDSMGELLKKLEAHLGDADQRARFRNAVETKSPPLA